MWLLEALGRFWAYFSTLTRSVLPHGRKMPRLPLLYYWKNPKEKCIDICGAAGIPLRREPRTSRAATEPRGHACHATVDHLILGNDVVYDMPMHICQAIVSSRKSIR